MNPRPVLVSACLTGLRCRYDGRKLGPRYLDKLEEMTASMPDGVLLVPVCPEQLGGLPTPRPRNELTGGDGFDVLEGDARVIDQDGRDVTEVFIAGAREALRMARAFGANLAVVKSRSPSCGYASRVSGDGGLTGVAAALWRRSGIEVRELSIDSVD